MRRRDALDAVVAHLDGSARTQAEAYIANRRSGLPGLFDVSVDAAVDSLVAASEEYPGH